MSDGRCEIGAAVMDSIVDMLLDHDGPQCAKGVITMTAEGATTKRQFKVYVSSETCTALQEVGSCVPFTLPTVFL